MSKVILEITFCITIQNIKKSALTQISLSRFLNRCLLHKHDDKCGNHNDNGKYHKGNTDDFKYLHDSIGDDFGIADFFDDDILDIIV